MTMPRFVSLPSLCFVLALACDKSTAPTDGAAKSVSATKSAASAPAGDADKPAADAPAEPPADEAVKAVVGQPAPEFALADLDGKTVKLSDHRGKIVVLEWFNPQCPFVKYAHGEGPLKEMAKRETDKGGVVWLAINSGAPGKQGAGVDNSREGATTYGMSHTILLDENGAVGKSYGAAKTPHIFVVDAEGKLVYAGGLDNAPMGEVDGGGEKTPYVEQALADLRAGKPVATAETKAYGCSVKYAS